MTDDLRKLLKEEEQLELVSEGVVADKSVHPEQSAHTDQSLPALSTMARISNAFNANLKRLVK